MLPKDSVDGVRKATITFAQAASVAKAVQGLGNRRSPLGTGGIVAKPNNYATVTIDSELYDHLKTRIDTTLDHIRAARMVAGGYLITLSAPLATPTGKLIGVTGADVPYHTHRTVACAAGMFAASMRCERALRACVASMRSDCPSSRRRVFRCSSRT